MIKHLFIIAGMIGVFMLISKFSIRSKQAKKRNITTDRNLLGQGKIARDRKIVREINA